MARPRLKIDPKLVEGMASVGATNIEIAEFAGCSVDTLTRRFADVLTKSRAGMRVRLRQLQWKAAAAGDRTMLIWLGKQELGQKDKSDVTSDDKAMAPVAISVTHTVVDPSADR